MYHGGSDLCIALTSLLGREWPIKMSVARAGRHREARRGPKHGGGCAGGAAARRGQGAAHGGGRAAPDGRDGGANVAAGAQRELSAKVWDSFSETWDVCWGRQPLEKVIRRRMITNLLTF
jgi:hypothetical protein